MLAVVHLHVVDLVKVVSLDPLEVVEKGLEQARRRILARPLVNAFEGGNRAPFKVLPQLGDDGEDLSRTKTVAFFVICGRHVVSIFTLVGDLNDGTEQSLLPLAVAVGRVLRAEGAPGPGGVVCNEIVNFAAKQLFHH